MTVEPPEWVPRKSELKEWQMHPSFGIEYKCPSLEWKDVMKGPSRDAVLAHTYKILHYRSLFDCSGPIRNSDQEQRFPERQGGTSWRERAGDRAEAA
jgi:hypothetical protein